MEVKKRHDNLVISLISLAIMVAVAVYVTGHVHTRMIYRQWSCREE